MSPDLRSVLVRLHDRWQDDPDPRSPLAPLFAELACELLNDKGRRDALAVPTEPLFLTPQFSALTRSQWRLFGAVHIAGQVAGGLTALLASAQHVEIAAKAVKLADRILKANDEFDRPPPPPATPSAVAVTVGPPVFAFQYLEWLAANGPALTTEGPQTVDPSLHGDARHHLLKAGLAAWVLGDQIAATPAGLRMAGVPAAGLHLGPQEDAA